MRLKRWGFAMTDSTDNALKPCPFCGSCDSFNERADFTSNYRFCNNCAARGPIVDAESAYEDADGDAVMEDKTAAAWNTRADLAPDPQAAALVDVDQAFMAAVWDALKSDANDLRKQQRILSAFRAAFDTTTGGKDE
jgi:hypothetical protein